jgi:hypothetical protein
MDFTRHLTHLSKTFSLHYSPIIPLGEQHMFRSFPFTQSKPRFLKFRPTMLVAALAIVFGSALHVDAQQPKSVKGVSAKTTPGFAVVELFTSQGCSSCPSADENLADITKQATQNGDKIITLSFHVDYWNYLGWRDPYSTADATTRQRLYAGVHGSKQVYTPQMVVNGTTELLGSSRDKSKAAIVKARKQRPLSDIKLETKNEGSTIVADWKIEGLQSNDLVNVALVQDYAEDRVENGENGGRTLKHVNVVREFKVINPAKEQDSLSFTIPKGVDAENLHVVAYLQSPMDASIHAAASSEVVVKK